MKTSVMQQAKKKANAVPAIYRAIVPLTFFAAFSASFWMALSLASSTAFKNCSLNHSAAVIV